MKRFLLFITLAVTSAWLCVLSAANTNSVAKPDFAFPQQVTKNAEKSLDAATKAGNDIAMIRALMDLTLAQGMIDNDNLPAVYRRINDLCPKMSSPAARSLTRLLQASILSGVYNDNRYKYNERQLPLTPLPADWTEWSGDQFRAEIQRLIDEALADPAPLKSTPISAYSSLLTLDRQSEIYYPTLYDFAITHAISLLSSNFSFPSNLPITLIDNLAVFPARPLSATNSPVADKILNLYSDLLRFNQGKYAPLINTTINSFLFINKNLYNSYSDEATLKEKEFWKSLFQKYYPLTEYSGDILLQTSESDYSDTKEFYSTLNNFIARYSGFWRNDCINSRLFTLKTPSLSFSVPNYVAPGKDLIATIRNHNAKEYYFNIYRLNSSRDILLSSTPVFHQKITSSKEAPFFEADTIKLTLSDFGRYLAVVSTDNAAPSGNNILRSGSVITCTSLGLGTVSGNNIYVYSFDPVTGAPVGNVDLYTKTRDVENSMGQTSKNGIAEISPDKTKYGYGSSIYPRLGNDLNGLSAYFSTNRADNEPKARITNVTLCDLPIYHPGDSINWETIIYSYNPSGRRPVAGYEVLAILNNANNLPIDTLSLTTDDFGRAGGSFLLPEGELTGFYTIEFESVKEPDDNVYDILGPMDFPVSDYKLPTFKVELLKNVMNSPTNGDVTVRGRVMTLSGVGLANTKVNLNLSATDRFRFGYGNSNLSFFADSVTTAADGSFSFVLADSVLNNSPYPKGFFNATVSATSLSGESQQASTSFSRGASYSISAKLTDPDFTGNVIESSKPARLSLKVLDAEGNTVDQQVKLTVTPANKEDINKGFTSIITPSTKEIDLRSLNPGRYKFTFTIADPQLKAVSDSVDTDYTIFRLNDSRSPWTSAVWGAKSQRNSRLAPGEKARIVYAVPENDSHLVYVLSSADSIIETKWIKCKKGVNELEVAIPKGKTDATVRFFGFRDFEPAEFSECISYAEDTLKIESESFRDKLIPGSEETWSFRIRTTSGSAQRTALALGMYNAALEKFNSSNWNIDFDSFSRRSISTNFNFYYNASYTRSVNLKSAKNPYSCISLTQPVFETYGYPFVSRYKTSRIMYKNMATAGRSVSSSDMIFDAVEQEPVFAAAPQMAELRSSAVAVDALQGQVPGLEVAESADEDSGASLDEVVTVSSPQSPAQTEFEYRDGETVLAFFRPSLTTDADGSLTFSFTVPNANTTWRLNALAYTENLMSAALNRTFVASKPVMVTPNLPRFLRAGDSATISSLVVNNSDEQLTILTTTEIFDPLSGKVLTSSTSTDTLAPGRNTTVSTTLDAPFDATAIGVRVKSSTPSFADGEQSLLPILPSSDPVIETTPFYISPDSTSFSLTLPKIGDDARVTLEYCDNPTWYVVTALPGLRQQKLSTPSDAAAAIFSAAVAEGILRSNPAIADALRRWTASDRSDSTLTSMLSRNADLKTLLLQATPWMVDAMTDTQRMQRLALLFEPKEIAAAYSESIDLLRRLQRNSGGWAWVNSSDEPSQWATSEALMTLGRLNRLGYLPSDKSLSAMITQALAWHQSQVEKDYRKYPKASYYSFLRLRDLWPDHKPSLTGKTIINREVQNLVSGWKKQSIGQKARSALLLAHNGYRSLASTVLKSIGEFAKSTPTKGMWWPSVGMDGSMEQLQVSADVLAALHELSPQSADIDPIRQWLILQKEARNWGSSVTTSEVICAILSTSSSWIQPASPATITVGSHAVPTSYSDATLGYLRTDISSLSPSLSELSIVKSGHTPSWGAVYSQSRMSMADIAPTSCEAVSIEKRLYLLRGTEWVTPDSLQVGDRVKVQLLIHADRDMQYVAITDSRAACLEPVEQLPTPIFSQGLCFYRENLDASTRLFVTNLPRGTYMLEYELWVNNAGTFSSGIATLQSQYAPQLSAHSAGTILNIGR